ncbi:hypothetical protein [Pseudomonas gingeri]|uniref:Uncharacterized protein n=1 Tax=Pseudomonas gingeri TaxID=117681 RepID=A0A7Y7Y1E9_9PSED|nr:hypothetical protein [Pseudomonas gingeri]NWC16188.1 hypothetical protein [Pseudomonas gingeri]
MLDSTKLEVSCRESVGNQWLELTDSEVRLIRLYRQMSESDRKQIRRISGYLAEPVESE